MNAQRDPHPGRLAQVGVSHARVAWSSQPHSSEQYWLRSEDLSHNGLMQCVRWYSRRSTHHWASRSIGVMVRMLLV